MTAQSYYDAAAAAGDEQWTMRGRLALGQIRQLTEPEGATEVLRQAAEQALILFGRIDDDLGLAHAHQCLSEVADCMGLMGEVMRETHIAVEHLTRAGRTRLAEIVKNDVMYGWMFGDLPASQGIADARYVATTADDRGARAHAWTTVAFFAELLGREDDERQAIEQAYRLEQERRRPTNLPYFLGPAALACGQGRDAVDLLAFSLRALDAIGAAGISSTVAGFHANALLLTGDGAAGRRQADLALATGSTDDVTTVGLAQGALAWSAAKNSEAPADVLRHIRHALDAIDTTDQLLARGLVHTVCAEAAQLIGDVAASRHHRQSAIDLYDAKENIVGAEVQRSLL